MLSGFTYSMNTYSQPLVRGMDENEDEPLDQIRWKYCIDTAPANYRVSHFRNSINKKQASPSRFYKYLNINVNYLEKRFLTSNAVFIFQSRCNILGLNDNRFDANSDKRCSLWNLNVIENVSHINGIHALFQNNMGILFFWKYEIWKHGNS